MAKEGSGAVSIRDVLLDMRKYRMGLIQTEFQLKFSYLAIAEGARQDGHLNLNILSGRFTHWMNRSISKSPAFSELLVKIHYCGNLTKLHEHHFCNSSPYFLT